MEEGRRGAEGKECGGQWKTKERKADIACTCCELSNYLFCGWGVQVEAVEEGVGLPAQRGRVGLEQEQLDEPCERVVISKGEE